MVKSTVLYDLLRVSTTASDAELRKSYLLLSRKLHPDKSDDPDAVKHFITLKKAYDILRDPAKRARYDRTGSTDEESQSFEEAYARYRGVPLTPDDISEYLSSYRGSEAEEDDLAAYFEEHSGDVSHVLGTIVGSSDADIGRFVEFFERGLASGRLSKKHKRRFDPSAVMSEAELEREAEEEADDLGEEDDDDEEDEDDYDDLADMIDDEGEGESEEEGEEEGEEVEEEGPSGAPPPCPPGVPPELFAQIMGNKAARAAEYNRKFDAFAARAKAAGKAEAAAKRKKAIDKSPKPKAAAPKPKAKGKAAAGNSGKSRR